MYLKANIVSRLVLIACGLLFVSGNVIAAPERTGKQTLQLQRVFAQVELEQPLAMLPAPAGADKQTVGSFYIVEQAGRVLRVQPGEKSQVFADIRMEVDNSTYEGGLLGMAFDPDFGRNGYVYLSYTREGDDGLVSVIARYTSQDRGLSLDDETLLVLLELEQPYSNHNGGQISFGPDGYLYIGFGDGGSAGDPIGHAQNTKTLHGALLRIDVASASRQQPYRIPADNPLVKQDGRDEIYAWGLRNPWRWSFDRESGQLWLGDAGQDDWEEIDIIEKGGNYGWNIREGAHCFESDDCQVSGLIDPIAEYPNGSDCSVTGGYVYRGNEIVWLGSVYVFGDFCSGKIWGLFRDGQGKYENRLLADTPYRISSFAEDHHGELYVIDYSGAIFKIRAPRGQ